MSQPFPAAEQTDPRVHEGPLAFVVEQLLGPVLATGTTRVAIGAGDDSGWVDLERYRAVPSVTRARMLIPVGPRPATVGALLNFRGLRRRVPNLQRSVLGAAARAGRLPFPEVALQARADQPVPASPLATVAEALGRHDLGASVAVNTSSNRKATLQVVDATGAPVGFAKFAWDPVSSTSVRAEGVALRALGGRGSTARAPELLGAGEYYGSPYIISAPLPLDSVGVRADVPPPSALELYSLLPLTRRDRVAGTGQYAALRERLGRIAGAGQQIAPVVAAALRLLDLVAEQDVAVPVQERCHGDLAAWNMARSEDGTLWLWDWESSEADTAAGLDALHWHMSARTEAGQPWDGAALLAAVDLARPLLRAAGTSRAAEPTVAGLYAATIAERAATLAAGAGGWEAGWVLPEQLQDMITAATQRLTGQG